MSVMTAHGRHTRAPAAEPKPRRRGFLWLRRAGQETPAAVAHGEAVHQDQPDPGPGDDAGMLAAPSGTVTDTQRARLAELATAAGDDGFNGEALPGQPATPVSGEAEAAPSFTPPADASPGLPPEPLHGDTQIDGLPPMSRPFVQEPAGTEPAVVLCAMKPEGPCYRQEYVTGSAEYLGTRARPDGSIAWGLRLGFDDCGDQFLLDVGLESAGWVTAAIEALQAIQQEQADALALSAGALTGKPAEEEVPVR